MVSFEKELRTAYKTGKLALGSRETVKYTKLGKAKMIIIARNADPILKKDIDYYASFSKIPVYVYEGTSIELGVTIGKPFPVQALAVLDPGESHILDLVE